MMSAAGIAIRTASAMDPSPLKRIGVILDSTHPTGASTITAPATFPELSRTGDQERRNVPNSSVMKFSSTVLLSIFAIACAPGLYASPA